MTCNVYIRFADIVVKLKAGPNGGVLGSYTGKPRKAKLISRIMRGLSGGE